MDFWRIILHPQCVISSGVAVGSGWQALVAFINIGSYYIVGIPLGVILGWLFGFGIKVIIWYKAFKFYSYSISYRWWYEREKNHVREKHTVTTRNIIIVPAALPVFSCICKIFEKNHKKIILPLNLIIKKIIWSFRLGYYYNLRN